jgi:hypothetical protein
LLLTLTAACAGPITLFASEGDARAQAFFGDKGQLAITGENLFVLSTERRAESAPGTGGDNIEVTNREGFLLTGAATTDSSSFSPRVPQIGGHYFIIPSLSIGGSIGYEGRGGSHTPPPVGAIQPASVPRNDGSSFVFNPKVGYVLLLNDKFSFWFRGGLGVYHYGESSGVDARFKDGFTFWFVSLDALFVFTPVQHVGFYLGPQGDITFTGSHSHAQPQGPVVAETSNSTSFRDIGIGAGMIAYFGP